MKETGVAIRQREKATFILHIMFRQNASWQGTVQWVEKQETLCFRSALELIKIIDSANMAGYQVSVNEEEATAVL